jgi:hypothetical protein
MIEAQTGSQPIVSMQSFADLELTDTEHANTLRTQWYWAFR